MGEEGSKRRKAPKWVWSSNTRRRKGRELEVKRQMMGRVSWWEPWARYNKVEDGWMDGWRKRRRRRRRRRRAGG
jgi:hypothetical protein